jgi:hypothetical protein
MILLAIVSMGLMFGLPYMLDNSMSTPALPLNKILNPVEPSGPRNARRVRGSAKEDRAPEHSISTGLRSRWHAGRAAAREGQQRRQWRIRSEKGRELTMMVAGDKKFFDLFICLFKPCYRP